MFTVCVMLYLKSLLSLFLFYWFGGGCPGRSWSENTFEGKKVDMIETNCVLNYNIEYF